MYYAFCHFAAELCPCHLGYNYFVLTTMVVPTPILFLYSDTSKLKPPKVKAKFSLIAGKVVLILKHNSIIVQKFWSTKNWF